MAEGRRPAPGRKRRLSKKGRAKRRKILMIKAAMVLFVLLVIAAIVLIIAANRKPKEPTAAMQAAKLVPVAQDKNYLYRARAAEDKNSLKAGTVEEGFMIMGARAYDILYPKYIWASPKGATGGTESNIVTKNDQVLREGEGNIVYLTFDDGPGQYTEQLLDLLARYDVKVTFFVTAQYPDYLDLIAREAAEGHSIAIHTYLHDYYDIYSSTEAFWADFEKMQDVVEQQTGHRSEIMRFPGGSSNTISNITPGIMTTLTQEAEQKHYSYIDWNISSGDGEVQTSRESVFNNITQQLPAEGSSVILCHDVKESTVLAMEDVIPWCLNNGYVFLPMSPNSNSAHHPINN